MDINGNKLFAIYISYASVKNIYIYLYEPETAKNTGIDHCQAYQTPYIV